MAETAPHHESIREISTLIDSIQNLESDNASRASDRYNISIRSLFPGALVFFASEASSMVYGSLKYGTESTGAASVMFGGFLGGIVLGVTVFKVTQYTLHKKWDDNNLAIMEDNERKISEYRERLRSMDVVYRDGIVEKFKR